MKDLIITLIELLGIAGAVIAYYYYLEHLLKRKLYEKLSLPSGTVPERFDIGKFFIGFFSMFNVTLWAKDLISLFNIRKLLVYALIIGGIFIYGYTKGNQNLPIKVDLGYGHEAVIALGDGTYMHITKTGEVDIIDNKNPAKAKILRIIKAKDLGALQGKLSAFGIQFNPIAVAGYGIGLKGDGGLEAGVGVSIFRYWQGSVEAFATQKGLYVGTSYRLDRLHLDNTSIGIAYGRSYSDWQEGRIMIYGKIDF